MKAKLYKVSPRNFEAMVLDTDDLSTVRGASLTLLQAPRLLSRHLAETVPNYREILCAASDLLFTVKPTLPVEAVDPNPNKMPTSIAKKERKALYKIIENAARSVAPTRTALLDAARQDSLKSLTDSLDAEQVAGMIFEMHRRHIRDGKIDAPEAKDDDKNNRPDVEQAVRDFLSHPIKDGDIEWPLDLFNFQVASAADGKSAGAVLDSLDTELNEAQWRYLTCPVPPPAGEFPCSYSPMLPASGENVKHKPASTSVNRRREAGRKGKSVFYREVLERGIDHLDKGATAFDGAREKIEAGIVALASLEGFAADFDGIKGKAKGLDLSPSAQSSLAVIAFDGNDFGSHTREAMHPEGFDGLRRFGQGIEAMSAVMLADILSFIARREAMQLDGYARFETLLWGADEFRFVVPGWAAWSFARHIHGSLSAWCHPLKGTPMTFGMGIAIAKAKTPIRDLSNAAYDLSEAAGTDKLRSMTQVLVFEGVDRVHISPTTLRAAWLGGQSLDDATFSMTLDAFDAAPNLLRELKAKVGLSAIRNWSVRHAERLGATSDDIDDEFWEAFKNDAGRIASDSFDVRDVLKKHEIVAGHAQYPLLGLAHAAMLNDYLPEGL